MRNTGSSSKARGQAAQEALDQEESCSQSRSAKSKPDAYGKSFASDQEATPRCAHEEAARVAPEERAQIVRRSWEHLQTFTCVWVW